MITVHDLSPNVEVIAEGSSPALPAALEAEVAATWEAERARRGASFFDGRLFCVGEISRARISGTFIPYRRYIAQRANPALFAKLRVRPLGVSGLLVCQDGVVFGRRAPTVTDNAGRWELVPSGGVDSDYMDAAGRVDVRRQIMAELAEEIGLEPHDIGSNDPFCAVEDLERHVTDIGIVLATPLSGPEVLGRHANLGVAEYSELAVVAERDLGHFVAGLGDRLIVASRALLRRRGLIDS